MGGDLGEGVRVFGHGVHDALLPGTGALDVFGADHGADFLEDGALEEAGVDGVVHVEGCEHAAGG